MERVNQIIKKLIWCLVIILRFADISAAGDSAFHSAGELYQQGDYEAALTAYQEIIQSGFEAPDLYYNMGNAAFRSNRIGHAILYFEKALKMDPSHEDAIHNLEFVSRYRVDAFDEVPEFFLRTWIWKGVRLVPERTWSILALFFFTLMLTSILFYLFTKRLTLKKAGFFTALLSLILFGTTLAASVVRHHNIVAPEQGVILSPSVVVRSTPSDSGTELFILHEGTMIRTNESVTGWQNIRIIDGREGWIRDADFERI